MKRIVRLTESDLARIVRRVINEAYTYEVRKSYGGNEYKLLFTGEPTITKGGRGVVISGDITLWQKIVGGTPTQTKIPKLYGECGGNEIFRDPEHTEGGYYATDALYAKMKTACGR